MVATGGVLIASILVDSLDIISLSLSIIEMSPFFVAVVVTVSEYDMCIFVGEFLLL